MSDTVWLSSCKRFIAFFDILGFKYFVQNHDISEVQKYMNAILIHLKSIEKVSGEIKIIFCSDSIFILTPDDTSNSLEHFIVTITGFIASCIHNGIPLKGAISYGDICIEWNNEKTIIFGNPVINAVNSHDNLKIIGCIVDDYFFNKCTLMKKENVTLVRFLDDIVKCEISLKDDKDDSVDMKKEAIIINWIPFMKEQLLNKKCIDKDLVILSNINNMKRNSPKHSHKYYLNTIDYIQSILNKNSKV